MIALHSQSGSVPQTTPRADRRSLRWTLGLSLVVSLVAAGGHARGDVVLSSSAGMVQPIANSTYYAGTAGYSVVTFEATNTWVSAVGDPYADVSLSWNMMIGWDEGNQGVRTDTGTSEVVRLDSTGRWLRSATLAGSDTVTVGTRHARTLSEIWVAGTQNRSYTDIVREFYVVAEAPPGGGGMGGD